MKKKDGAKSLTRNYALESMLQVQKVNCLNIFTKINVVLRFSMLPINFQFNTTIT